MVRRRWAPHRLSAITASPAGTVPARAVAPSPPDDPLSARGRIEARAGFASASVRCRIETVTEIVSTRTTFDLTCRIDAYENQTIPRNFM
jgi:hypothetical protein